MEESPTKHLESQLSDSWSSLSFFVENVSPERMALDGVPICPFGTSLGNNTCAIASQWMSFRLPIFVEVYIHHPMLSMVFFPTRGKFNAWTCPRWGLPPTLEKRKDHANQSELGRSHCRSNQKKYIKILIIWLVVCQIISLSSFRLISIRHWKRFSSTQTSAILDLAQAAGMTS